MKLNESKQTSCWRRFLKHGKKIVGGTTLLSALCLTPSAVLAGGHGLQKMLLHQTNRSFGYPATILVMR